MSKIRRNKTSRHYLDWRAAATITSLKDFEEVLLKIADDSSPYPIGVGDKLDADQMNFLGESLEKHINTLYEKIRLLEDADEFANEYMTSKIIQKTKQLREALKIIEDISDEYKSKEYISILVPFISDGSPLIDRDGTLLSQSRISSKLEPADDKRAKAYIASITFSSDYPCYNNSYDALLKNKPGISYYSLELPAFQGITETVFVSLTESTIINKVRVSTTNTSIVQAKVIDDKNMTHNVWIDNEFSPLRAKQIQLILNSSAYKRISKLGDSSRYNTAYMIGAPDPSRDNFLQKIVKNMEISLEKSMTKYNASTTETIARSWNQLNNKNQKKNIIESGV